MYAMVQSALFTWRDVDLVDMKIVCNPGHLEYIMFQTFSLTGASRECSNIKPSLCLNPYLGWVGIEELNPESNLEEQLAQCRTHRLCLEMNESKPTQLRCDTSKATKQRMLNVKC